MLLINTITIPKLILKYQLHFQRGYNSKMSMVCLRAQSKALFSKLLLLSFYSDAQSKTQILSEQGILVGFVGILWNNSEMSGFL